MALAESTNASPRLLKGIGLLAAIALMLTNAIGTGVFLKARVMICNVGTPAMVLLAYVVAGLFTLAGAVMARVLGAGASVFMAAGLMVSSFGSLHSSVLTMARVPFAMARDGLFPSLFARVSRRFHVPTYSVLFMGVCAICFAMSGTFDMLTDMVVFS